MLILAAVTINLTIGDNGIFKKSVETIVLHENANVYERLSLKVVDDELTKAKDNVEIDILSKLQDNGYVNADNSVNASKVTEANMRTGKGTIGSGDVYVIEEESNEAKGTDYYLIYYTESNERRNLGKLLTEEASQTPIDIFEFNPDTGGICIKNIESYYGEVEFWELKLGLKTITIPSTYNGQTVTMIGVNGFGINLTDVEKIVIPNTVTKLEGRVFFNCQNLKRVNLSNSITSISGQAFRDCNGLEEITIPSSVVTMGEAVFYECRNLKKIYVPFKEGETPSGWDSKWAIGWHGEIIYKD